MYLENTTEGAEKEKAANRTRKMEQRKRMGGKEKKRSIKGHYLKTLRKTKGTAGVK